jgi:hypothetical protein
VTGCPSLYQCGRDLRIPEGKVPREAFRPVVNGRVELVEPLLQADGDVPFVDQRDFLRFFYDPSVCNEHDLGLRDMVRLIERHGAFTLRMMGTDRIQFFRNMPEWRNFLMENGFSFSFGSRIHGNLMAILAGIPTVVCACDSRTREMAEFRHGLADRINANNAFFTSETSRPEDRRVTRAFIDEINRKLDRFGPVYRAARYALRMKRGLARILRK